MLSFQQKPILFTRYPERISICSWFLSNIFSQDSLLLHRIRVWSSISYFSPKFLISNILPSLICLHQPTKAAESYFPGIWLVCSLFSLPPVLSKKKRNRWLIFAQTYAVNDFRRSISFKKYHSVVVSSIGIRKEVTRKFLRNSVLCLLSLSCVFFKPLCLCVVIFWQARHESNELWAIFLCIF